MDSIFEQPRVTPIPLSKKEIPTLPLVPEVSMIFQNNTTMQNGNDSMYLTYNAWKARNQNTVGLKSAPKQSVKTASPFRSQADSFATKQVRFESERNQMFNTPVDLSRTPVSDVESRFSRSKTKPFEQIYMANIPDRHLDLSVIESPKKLRPKENQSPNTNLGFHTSTLYQQNFTNHQNKRNYEDVKQIQHNFTNHQNKRNNEEVEVKQILDRFGDDPFSKNQIIDLYNYKRDTNTDKLPYTFKHISNDIKSNENYQAFSNGVNKCSVGTQTENNLCEIKRTREEEPTVKDLLNIIQQQNNQLLILQKQVSMLLNNKEQQIQNGNVSDNNYCTSTHVESQKIDICKNIPQFGLQSRQQLSVEVSIRRQQHLNQMGKEATNHTPKICEIIEENSPENILSGIPKNNEYIGESYENGLCTIDGSVHVPQPCPSPECSIDYGSVEEYSDDSEDEQQNTEQFFIEGQVNHILKESGINPNNNYPRDFLRKPADSNKVDRLKKRVLNATLKQLHKLGVEVPIKENMKIKSNESNKEFEKEVSFIVEQLLMKLLPNEHLAKLTYKHTQTVTSPVKHKQNNLIQRRPEFSLASMQYLRKYNLLTDSSGQQFVKQNEMSTPNKMDHGPGKFLDVTELRQLSKLPDKDK